MCEIANIREHCSWVHEKGDATTEKALDLVRMQVEKVKRDRPLNPIKVPVTKKALVIGGGIAGIQAALDIANCGHKVILVEKEPSIGGHMSQLSETFPTLDCSQCILTPRMVEVAQHPNITLYTYAELESLEGFIGNFKARIRLKGTQRRPGKMHRMQGHVPPNALRKKYRANSTLRWGSALPYTCRSRKPYPTNR